MQQRPKKSRTPRILIPLLLILAGVLALWLGNKPEVMEQLIHQNATSAKAPEQPGQVRRGVELPPPEMASAPADEANASAAVGNQTGSRTEDRIVPLDFLDGLAEFAVESYQPGRSELNPGPEGITSLSFKRANMRFGVDPARFDHPGPTAADMRAEVLGYLFRAGTAPKLYDLYADEFLTRLVDTAREARRSYRDASGGLEERPLSRDEIAEMLRLYSDLLASGSRVVSAAAASPDLTTRVDDYHTAVRGVNGAYEEFWKASEAGPAKAEEAGRRIKDAIVRRETLKTAIVNNLKRAGEVELQPDEVLYLGEWSARRLSQNPDNRDALKSMADVMLDFSRRLREEAATLPAG